MLVISNETNTNHGVHKVRKGFDQGPGHNKAESPAPSGLPCQN